MLELTASRQRPAWRAWLLLSRVSNLPTVWTNVLAGIAAAHGTFQPAAVAGLAFAASLLYTAGMFLNDAFDREVDAVQRPDRPIPAGNVPAAVVFAAGFATLFVGEVVIGLVSGRVAPLLYGIALAGAIVYYDYRHKRDYFSPLVMGICRGLVYCVAAAAVARVDGYVVAVAIGLTAYVLLLTQVAKVLGPRAGVVIPLLIAGISIFDAIVIGLSGGGVPLMLLAAAGFPLTLAAQRIVPGT